MCTAYLAGTLLVVVTSSFTASLREGRAVLTVHGNPVYNGEPVLVSCNYGNDNQLTFVAIDAFSKKLPKGSLSCRIPKPNTTGDGVFTGMTFSGCPSLPVGSTHVNVSMIASPNLELNCTAVVINQNGKQYTLPSNMISMVVNVLPEIPQFLSNPLIFNESGTATVICESRNGKPAAAVMLTVSSLSGDRHTTIGLDTASLTLPLPLLNWHNATAMCNVTNHKFSNMTASTTILFNHISCTNSSGLLVGLSKNVTLDCSAFISSHPAALFSWPIPSDNRAANSGSVLRGPVLSPLHGHDGVFNCTATNDIVEKRATVVFNASSHQTRFTGIKRNISSQCSLTSTLGTQIRGSSTEPPWVIPVIVTFVFLVVIIAASLVVAVLLSKRSRASAGKETESLGMQSTKRENGVYGKSLKSEKHLSKTNLPLNSA